MVIRICSSVIIFVVSGVSFASGSNDATTLPVMYELSFLNFVVPFGLIMILAIVISKPASKLLVNVINNEKIRHEATTFVFVVIAFGIACLPIIYSHFFLESFKKTFSDDVVSNFIDKQYSKSIEEQPYIEGKVLVYDIYGEKLNLDAYDLSDGKHLPPELIPTNVQEVGTLVKFGYKAPKETGRYSDGTPHISMEVEFMIINLRNNTIIYDGISGDGKVSALGSYLVKTFGARNPGSFSTNQFYQILRELPRK